MVKRDDGTYLQAFQFGSTNARLMSHNYETNQVTMIASNGGTTVAEYTQFTLFVLTWTKRYTYLGDSQLSTVTPNGTGGEMTEYNHPDRLGTRVITNQAAGTNYEQTTLPFGTALNAESSVQNNRKRFTSYERSAQTGLDYAINRTYDSKLGRFTQVDPIGMSASSLGSPQTLNLYSYCGNDPINHTDPDGLFWRSLFRSIGNFFKRVLRAAVQAAITALFTFVTSGFNVGAAAAAFVGAFIANLAFPKFGNILTPGWNPDVRHPLSGGSGLSSIYVIRNFRSAYEDIARLGILSVAGAIASFFASFSGLQGNCGVNPITGKPGFKDKPIGETGNLRDPSGGRGDFKGPRYNSKTKRRYTHGALDIAGDLNKSPVYAYRGGRVIGAGNGGRLGNFVKIDHGNGIVSTYGHLKKDSITAGILNTDVAQGDQIGILGNTGNAGGLPSHVHVKITQDGVPIDPADHLNKPCP